MVLAFMINCMLKRMKVRRTGILAKVRALILKMTQTIKKRRLMAPSVDPHLFPHLVIHWLLYDLSFFFFL